VTQMAHWTSVSGEAEAVARVSGMGDGTLY
jgi:hypothetical protein